MVSQELQDKVNVALSIMKKEGDSEETANALYEYGRYIAVKEGDVQRGMNVVKIAKSSCERMIAKQTGADWYTLDKWCQKHKQRFSVLDLFYACCLSEAQHGNFESYLIYVEKNRPFKDRFYMPRRKQFQKIGLIQAMQDLLDDKLDLLTISMPPGTSKTTLEKFFHSYVCGLYPKDFNLFFSHSADICRMYYEGVLSILTDKEYLWHEVFPDLKIGQKNAKALTINIGAYKPFQNVMTGSVGSELSGKVRASKFLLVDDMIGKLEEALNMNTLDKLWNTYNTDARQRMIDGCKQIIIATRWSVHDPIGRLQNIYGDDPRARFISVADIDEKTGESNFDFEYNGFSVKFFNEQEKVMDDISYRCLYKNEPIEREGLLYHTDEVRRYYDLPNREADAIWGECDTKNKGTDFMALPVFYQYDDDYYLVDTVFDDSADFNLQYRKLVDIIVEHNVQQCEIESNNGGERVAFEIENRLKELHHRCNITTKPTETNKETKIIVNSDWIKKHVLFKAQENIVPKSDYDKFMKNLFTFSISGKVAHDDAPDVLANFSLKMSEKERIKPSRISRGIL